MPWSIIAACNVAAAIIILILRFFLVRENNKRDEEERDYTYDDVYIKKELPDGTTIEAKVDKVRLSTRWSCPLILTTFALQAFLDLTDKQNRDFRYVL